ncbi:MAG: single-stranded-DNA-specific exonuclease RecJ [Chloroflexota bacterium]
MVTAGRDVIHTPKRWVLAEPPPEAFQRGLPDLHPLLLRLLYNRGFHQPEAVRRHHQATFADLHDPFLMPAMARAVDRLERAARDGDLVVVYGDFDADGVTGSAIVEKALLAIGARSRSYIPKRLEEGYGLHSAALERLAEEGARVVVTVDCGVTSLAEVDQARELGIDVIICDHHKPSDSLPEALAILHPGMGGYPFPHLCAAGVCFKLAQALATRRPTLDPAALTDFAAVGTLADMVPLTGENRLLVKHGLERLRLDPSPGLRAMIELAGIDRERLTCSDVSFTLAPHINASGRLDDAGLAFSLMVTGDEVVAAELAARLRELNVERQRLTAEVLEAARQQVLLAGPDAPAYVVGGEGWPPGVVGLVAGKLAEEQGKPVFAMELGGELCRGSARGVPGFDLVEALGSCRELLTRFGGHPRAAGFTLRRDSYEAFREAIAQRAGATLSSRDVHPAITIDSELKMRHLNWDIHRLVQEVAPFGTGNPAPTFLLRGMQALRPRSTARNHLMMAFSDGRQTVDAFAYGMGHCAEEIKRDPKIDVVFELSSSSFKGFESLELRVRDLRWQ